MLLRRRAIKISSSYLTDRKTPKQETLNQKNMTIVDLHQLQQKKLSQKARPKPLEQQVATIKDHSKIYSLKNFRVFFYPF